MNFLDFFKNFPFKKAQPLPKKLPLLKIGSTDTYYVNLLHKQLISSGTSPKSLANDIPSSSFSQETKNAVIEFQQTHIDSDKRNLAVDGIVGDSTWWALFNYDSESQRIGLEKITQTSLSGNRSKVLSVAWGEYNKNIKEVPSGSNWGPDVSKYLKFIGIGPNAWCCAFAQWCVYTALGSLPWKTKGAHVATFWRLAKKLGMAFEYRNYSPIPGDLFVIVHSNDQGHIGIVSNVDSATSCTKFNAIEGNSGDRVALRERIVGHDDHIGYINFYGDSKNRPSFKVGLSSASSNDGKEKTR